MKQRKEQISGAFTPNTANCLRAYANSIDRSMADTIRIIVENFLLKKGLLIKNKERSGIQK